MTHATYHTHSYYEMNFFALNTPPFDNQFDTEDASVAECLRHCCPLSENNENNENNDGGVCLAPARFTFFGYPRATQNLPYGNKAINIALWAAFKTIKGTFI